MLSILILSKDFDLWSLSALINAAELVLVEELGVWEGTIFVLAVTGLLDN
jgi:hypothetical protein